ncbi:MAG: hypothetical protein D8H99_08215 [Streptococcus sp.]|nr:MAG: hypothetical protein D8H99_08215 [Streptococcus sp.]
MRPKHYSSSKKTAQRVEKTTGAEAVEDVKKALTLVEVGFYSPTGLMSNRNLGKEELEDMCVKGIC